MKIALDTLQKSIAYIKAMEYGVIHCNNAIKNAQDNKKAYEDKISKIKKG